MAFFAMFSLAPLFMLLLSFLDRLFGDGVARSELYATLVRGLGEETASALQALVLQPGIFEGGMATILVNILLTAIGAAALFRHMQASLAIVWASVTEDTPPAVSTSVSRVVQGFLRSFFAMGMLTIVAVGGFFLLAMGLLIGPIISQSLVGLSSPALWPVLSTLTTLLASLLIFGTLYRTLAPATPNTRRLWIALATLTVGLFFGKTLVTSLAQTRSVFSLFGAGSTVIYLLLWCFFLSQLFLASAIVADVAIEREKESV